MRGSTAAALATGLALLAGVPPAHATWGPPDIVSVDDARQEQGDSATLNAQLSGDASTVAFQTRATNFFADDDPDPPAGSRQGGVFTFRRATGALSLVADGDVVDASGRLVQRGAANPSVSADGRYVVFQTNQRLVPADTNDNVDVYVRDLSVPIGPDRAASGAYTLVDARDGGDVPATFAPRDPPAPGATPGAGVAPGTAISADGRYVVFRTTELASDLPDAAGTTTPAGNVFVRDLREKRTVLVSRRQSDGAPAGGAGPGLAISADGTTIAWTAQNAPEQTRFLPGEVQDDNAYYYLWRRWADAGAVTRRITGLADPDDPACGGGSVDTSSDATGPCEGPLTDTEQGLSSIQSIAPALSGDGYTVAFVAAGALRPQANVNSGLDLFVTDMHPGVSRKAGTRELTRDPVSGSPTANGPVDSVAISADATRIVFGSTRTTFLLPAPRFDDVPRAVSGGDELYALDRRTDTIDRVVRNVAGGDQDAGELTRLSISADGATVGYLSGSGDLITGDANGTVDAFTSSQLPPALPPMVPAGVGRRPGTFSAVGAGEPELVISPKRRRDGGIDLRVTAPGLGRIAATASSVPPAAKKSTSAKRRAAARPVVLAAAQAKVVRTLKLTLALKPDKVARERMTHGRAVKVRIAVTFTPATGRARHRTLTGSFSRPSAKKPGRSATKRPAGGRG